MKRSAVALSTLLSALFALPASAQSPCPMFGNVTGPTASAPNGGWNGGGCNIIIAVTPLGTTTAPGTATSPYEFADDVLVGVTNTSGATIYSLSLSASGNPPIFNFEFDGPCDTFGTGVTGCPPAQTSLFSDADCANLLTGTTGYEGPGTFFRCTTLNNGTVNFSGGLASGSTAWFALEGTPNAQTLIVPPPVTTSPEPATLAMLVPGLLGLGGLTIRRRRSA